MSSAGPDSEAVLCSGTSLRPLTPAYNEAEHAVYLRHLRATLKDHGSIHNIALMGGYGVGKSSILQELTKELDDRAVSLSLATLGEASTARNETPGENPAATSVTNRIQKEILKQLLYRERPKNVPSSRFRRRTVFNWRQAIVNSALASAVLVVVLYLTHVADRLADLMGRTLLVRGVSYMILLMLSLLIFSWLQRAFHDQARIQQFVAGPASVTLDPTSSSYFDEWLDEIVYFFEATKVDVLIFEDIDRFDDPHIFETLRELNTILNNSKQLNGRNVRFIYAIKDSIFEQLGLPTASELEITDAAEAETRRANRTKFFDLVIPVVPFITHRSARDLMSRQLEGWGLTSVSRELIDLAARHVADMRLITNICNEFVVFREKLLGDTGIPGLSDNQLFAMMLYKNVHLSEFELIRTGASKLDTLYRGSRQLVKENVIALNRHARQLNQIVADPDPLTSRSEHLGDALEAYINRVVKQHRVNDVRTITIQHDGRQVSSQELRTVSFWRSFLQNGWQLEVQTYPHVNANSHFTAGNIGNGLGEDLSPDRWVEHDVDVAERQLANVEKDRVFLTRANLRDLCDRPDFKLSTEEGKQSFAEVVKKELDSQLAVDLVTNGYIDQNFTLYVSQYYGEHVSSQAMNFILKHAQPNGMDPYFHFDSPADIEAVLRERGHAMLNDRSSYNIAILDYLIEHLDQDLSPDLIIHRLAVWGQDERVFSQAYIAGSKHAAELIRRLSGFWPRTLPLVVHELDVDERQRAVLVNAALLGANLVKVITPDEPVKTYIECNYQKLAVLTDASEPSAVTRVVNLLGALEVTLPTISPLSDPARAAVVDLQLYALSKDNLADATGSNEGDLSLDHLQAASHAVYAYVQDKLQTYVGIIVEQTAAPRTIDAPGRFMAILEDVAKHDASVLPEIIKYANPVCYVSELSGITSAAWPGLARNRRFPLTLTNVQAYVSEYGVDENLAVSLLADPQITEIDTCSEAEAQNLAATIVDARGCLPDPKTRVQIVQSLQLEGPIEANRIDGEQGKLAGLLVEAGIVDDTAAVYGAVASANWETKEFLITKSANFTEYVVPELLPTDDLQQLLKSKIIVDKVKRSVVAQIKRFAASVSNRTLQTVADYALRMQVPLDAETLLLLAEARVAATTIVPLLHGVLSDMPQETLQTILKGMGGKYAILAGPSFSSAKLPNDPAHHALAAYLRAGGDVSTFHPTRDKKNIKVNMKRPYRGERV
jgi:hypothetical protein